MFCAAFKSSIPSGLLYIYLLLGLAHAQPVEVDQKIEPQVIADLRQTGKTTVFVVLRAQANVSDAAGIADWNIRGDTVASSLKEIAVRTQQPILDFLANANAEVTPFWIVNTIKITTSDEQLIQWLAAMPEVAAIKADQISRIPQPLPGTQESTVQGIEWGVARVRAPEVWNQFDARGEGIVIANVDTGVQYNHPALVNQYQGSQADGTFNHNYSWHDPSGICGNPSFEPCDNNGHGTHTMGTAVGDDGAANQIGVAPGAQWIAAKGCETNNCSISALLSSGQWVLAPTDLNGQNPRPDLRPHIVTNSWSAVGSDTFYQATVQAWRNAGIFPVFSIGNNGSACASAGVPGAYLESFAVGATDILDNIASFSSRGPAFAFGNIVKPDVTAPGVSVRSSFPTDSYASMSGTSMATPHVAGVVALLWSANPGLIGDIAGTETILRKTAQFRSSTQCGPTGPPNDVYGSGIIDALAAVQGLAPVTLVASPASVASGGTLTATWNGIASPSSADWIALYQPGSANTAFIEWIYVSCSKSPGGSLASGSCPFTVPSSLPPATYELRLLANNGFTAIAISNTFTVTSSAGPTLTANPTSIPSGGTLTATWNGIASPSSADWIGLYQPGSSNTAYIEWIYVSCSKSPGSPLSSGSCPFVVPASLPTAAYELRLLANNGFTTLATSNAFTVGGGGVEPTLTANPTNVPAGGTLTAAWTGIASPTSRDWIGLYQPGAGNTAFIDWIYVSCTKTPGSPRGAGACPFVLPSSLPAGPFELRLLSNDGFTSLASSNTFAVAIGQASAR
jgi:subtilisin family serine protease